MLKRDAFGAARLLESKADDVFPEGTEIDVIRIHESGEWGVRIKLEGREVNYTQQEDVTRFLNDYLEKLERAHEEPDLADLPDEEAT